jgi:hypothetical protein
MRLKSDEHSFSNQRDARRIYIYLPVYDSAASITFINYNTTIYPERLNSPLASLIRHPQNILPPIAPGRISLFVR